MEYLRTIQAQDDEWRRGLRALGALLLGVGVLVFVLRETNFGDPLGDFAVFLLFLAPAVLLYGGGYLAARTNEEPQAWQGVAVIFGLLFCLFTFLQFVEVVDGNPNAALNVAWIFGAVAALGAAAALIAGVRFGLLAAGLAFSVAWLALWSEILGDDFEDAGTLRGLSVLAAVILGVAAVWLHRERKGRVSLATLDDPDVALPSELVTAAGLIFLFGTGILSATGAIAEGFVSALGPLAPEGGASGVATPSLFWDLVLLAGSLMLLVLGTRVGMRGPAYIGALGLAIFVVLVGLDLDDSSPAGSFVGWPLLLLLAAVAALVASVLLPARGLKRSPEQAE